MSCCTKQLVYSSFFVYSILLKCYISKAISPCFIHSFLLIKNSSFCTKFPKFMCASLRKNISLFLVYYKHFIKSTVFCRISVFLLVEIDARIGPLPCNTNWIIPPTSAAAMPGQTR